MSWTQSSVQLVAANRRRGSVNHRAGTCGNDKRNSRSLVTSLRYRSGHRRNVLGKSGADHGFLFYGAWRRSSICSASFCELVYGCWLWRIARGLWRNYREEIRWLNNQQQNKQLLESRSLNQLQRATCTLKLRVPPLISIG